MPYVLEDLIIDRVDLVDEGANSAAFIEFYKRKENKESMNLSEILSKLKPEHAEVIQQHIDGLSGDLNKAREDLDAANAENSKLSDTINEQSAALSEANGALAKANEELEVLKAKDTECSCDGDEDDDGTCKACGKPKKKSASFDETEVLKSMPEGIREEFLKMRAQKEAAEEQVRKAAEEKIEAEAVAKANTMKALPVEQSVLVQILKSCDATVAEVLANAAAAIEGTVLSEVGKRGEGKPASDPWERIEAEAEKVAQRDSISKQKAIGVVIKENPELYKEYLNGGTN